MVKSVPLATTAFGRAVGSLKIFIESGKGPWSRVAAHAEEAVGRSYRGAVSLEEIFVHQQTAERIVRHTIVNEGTILHETFRATAKFGLK
ncbi:MAG: hypothetical protein A2105_06180 [Omnitrophica WOR_2 bacterium GWF2_63_9]|nr:MAG: hypothetical protein A2105_06180 [Omnitrophica WOR_2 bacterium GWF2_63_9]